EGRAHHQPGGAGGVQRGRGPVPRRRGPGRLAAARSPLPILLHHRHDVAPSRLAPHSDDRHDHQRSPRSCLGRWPGGTGRPGSWWRRERGGRMAGDTDATEDVSLADREDLVAFARRMAPDDLAPGTSGNLSVRRGGVMAITPSGMPYE